MAFGEQHLSGKCGMQLVVIKDTFYEVEYTLLVGEGGEGERPAVKKVEDICCTDLNGMPTGTYILTDLPNLMLSNFTGKWTFTEVANS